MDHRQHPIDEVAPGGHQLFVDAPGDLGDRDLGVGLFGERRGQGVAQGVGFEAVETLFDGEADAAARRGLAALEGHVLVGRDVVGQVQGRTADAVADAEQLRRPEQGVERDVVLADEVDVAGVVVVPPVPPPLGVALGGSAHSFDAER